MCPWLTVNRCARCTSSCRRGIHSGGRNIPASVLLSVLLDGLRDTPLLVSCSALCCIDPNRTASFTLRSFELIPFEVTFPCQQSYPWEASEATSRTFSSAYGTSLSRFWLVPADLQTEKQNPRMRCSVQPSVSVSTIRRATVAFKGRTAAADVSMKCRRFQSEEPFLDCIRASVSDKRVRAESTYRGRTMLSGITAR